MIQDRCIRYLNEHWPNTKNAALLGLTVLFVFGSLSAWAGLTSEGRSIPGEIIAIILGNIAIMGGLFILYGPALCKITHIVVPNMVLCLTIAILSAYLLPLSILAILAASIKKRNLKSIFCAILNIFIITVLTLQISHSELTLDIINPITVAEAVIWGITFFGAIAFLDCNEKCV